MSLGNIPIEKTALIVDTVVLTELRALRLWHWRRVRSITKSRDDLEFTLRELRSGPASYYDDRLKKLRDEHAMHMGAVQTLNRFFAIGDTAERDDV